MTEVRDRNLAELNRQLERKQKELQTLLHLSEWGNQSYRFGITQCRERIEILNQSIKRA